MVLKNFIALVPITQTRELDALAQNCVEALDSFRAPLTDSERMRREAFGLIPESHNYLTGGVTLTCANSIAFT